MYPVSGELIRRARTSRDHEVSLSVELPTGETLGLTDLPVITEGTFNVAENAVRRSGNLNFITEDDVPKKFQKVLDNDTSIFKPTLYGVPLGEFTLKDMGEDVPGAFRQWRLQLADQSAVVAERKSTQPANYWGTPEQVAQAMVESTGTPVRFAPTLTTPQEQKPNSYFVDVDSNMWDAARQALEPAGLEIYMDIYGDCVIRNIPEVNVGEAIDLTDLVLSRQTQHTRSKTNHVILIVENEDEPPFRAEAVDDDPESASYFYGTRGDVPVTVRTKGIRGQGAAEDAAKRILSKLKGRGRVDTFALSPLPIFELGDTFKVRDELYIVKQASMSIVYSRPMYLTSRQGPTGV